MNPQDNSAFCQELADFFNARHSQLQKYLFWRVRSQEVAEDLAQETYLRFLKQSEPRQILDLNAFLFTIATNLARDHLRQALLLCSNFLKNRPGIYRKASSLMMNGSIWFSNSHEELIDDQQAIRLEDATRNVSGIHEMKQLGGLYENFVIRGFTTPDFNIYRDGLRLGLQSFETANLESIEVLKGPTSTLYGRGAFRSHWPRTIKPSTEACSMDRPNAPLIRPI